MLPLYEANLMTWRGKMLMYGGVLLKLPLHEDIEIIDEWNEVIPWMGGPIHGCKIPIATIGGSARDGTDARPRRIPSIIHGIAFHPWIAMINEWRATYGPGPNPYRTSSVPAPFRSSLQIIVTSILSRTPMACFQQTTLQSTSQTGLIRGFAFLPQIPKAPENSHIHQPLSLACN